MGTMGTTFSRRPDLPQNSHVALRGLEGRGGAGRRCTTPALGDALLRAGGLVERPPPATGATAVAVVLNVDVVYQYTKHTKRERMRRMAVTNQKGGSGKTTTAVNLAAALGEAGRRVLVLDLDPQASASAWLGVKDGGRGLLDVFTEGRDLASLVHSTEAPGVDVVPSSAWLVGVDKALAGEVGSETILRRALERLPDRWDVVIVDCPPSLGLLAISALVGCPEVLVPVETRVMALAGLAALVQTLERVRERLNPELRLTGLLACRVDARTRLSQDVIGTMRERFGGDVFRAVIRENVRLAEAPSFGKPITLYDTRSAGAEDYRAAASELAARWRKDTKQTQQPKHTKGKR